MKENTEKYNIRYLGFQSLPDGSRRFEYAITAPGRASQRASFEIPSSAFSGSGRVSFQESAALCYEKLRDVVGQNNLEIELYFKLTEKDIEVFRPRGRRAAARNKA